MNELGRRKSDKELKPTLAQQYIDVCFARGFIAPRDKMISQGARLLVPGAYGKQKR